MDKEFLYELMSEFEKRNIQELTFENSEGSIHLLKAEALPGATSAGLGATVASPAEVAPGKEAPKAEKTSPEGLELVRAPIVGNFYRQPAPDAPYFVNEGDRIRKGQTLCILEAMKLMNELPAEFDCEIVRVVPENGAMVEFDAALFEVRRL